METKHKTFKPFDKVLVQNIQGVWMIDFYSNWNEKWQGHQTFKVNGDYAQSDDGILPYEGNEHLVGTTDEPDEEVKLEEGEWLMVTNSNIDAPLYYNLRQYYKLDKRLTLFHTKIGKAEGTWNFAIRLSDFNPDDMEETKKHILCVKNGRIVKYHGKD